MKEKSTLPTMKDVAKKAGVSLGTVSKVFNDIPVGKQYKEKVESAAKALGYQVNNYARGMRTNQTYTVAIIMPVISHPFFATLTEHLCRELAERGYRSLISVTDWDSETEEKCINMVIQNKADGIIALTYNQFDWRVDIPFISIDRTFEGRIPCVASDNYQGGFLAASKLHELGSTNLLFLRTGSTVPGETDKRGAGFEAYCKANDIPHHAIYRNNGAEVDELYDTIRNMVVDGTFPYDGIFCSTDHLAYTISEILKKKGVAVPEQVQLIGFDGIIDFYSKDYICSTIVQPVEQIARTCVTSLLSMDKDTPPSLVCLPVSYAKGPTTRDWKQS